MNTLRVLDQEQATYSNNNTSDMRSLADVDEGLVSMTNNGHTNEQNERTFYFHSPDLIKLMQSYYYLDQILSDTYIDK